MIGAEILLILRMRIMHSWILDDPIKRALGRIPLGEARTHLAAGQFRKGSMGPKIESAIRFLEAGGKIAVVTSPPLAREALAGRAGTIITP
jgi:carbamate kinase